QQGVGWKRWNRRWLYDTLRLQRLSSAAGHAESRSSRIGLISPGMKQMGERSAGNPHAAFDVEGTGDVARHRAKPARQSSTLPMSGVWEKASKTANPPFYRIGKTPRSHGWRRCLRWSDASSASNPFQRAGKRVTVVEARDRCGGRNYPLPDQAFGCP